MEEKPEWIIALENCRRSIQEKEQQYLETKPNKTPYHERQEKIVNGTIKWEPIDKTAALVVSQAPWWAHFNERKNNDQTRNEKTNTEDQNEIFRKKKIKKIRKMTTPPLGKGARIQHHPNSLPPSEGDVHIYKGPGGEDYFKISEMAPAMIKEMNQHVHEMTPLARAAFDARGVLNDSLAQVGLSLDEFKAKSKILLDELRGTRFSAVSETTQMLSPLKELRQFFLGKDYDEEIKRLKEFVELCERLQKLKQDGTLDAVADTMVKLAVA